MRPFKALPLLVFQLTLALNAADSSSFANVSDRTVTKGFRAIAVYLNDADQPFGARFVHQKSGFTLDLLELQSVPQAFIWVNTFPESDQGEPHTQEHLLLTKGDKGHGLGASEAMSLTESSAFTMQWRTCYDFNTQAGMPVFYQQFDQLLDALLHPDYADEEIRREVRNFGVSLNPATHQSRLEEKGSVYNEMVASTSNPFSAAFRQIGLDLYGVGHPLFFNSGGEPAGLRLLGPEGIRAFHRTHYFLENMGAVVSLSHGPDLDQTLAQLDSILSRVQPEPVSLPVFTEASLPPPKPATSGGIQIVDYPFQTDQQPSIAALAWPAERKLQVQQELLLTYFLGSFGNGSGSNLYRLFIDSKTRKMDTGAQSVFAFVSSDQGFPVTVGFTEVAAAGLNERSIAEMRGLVTAEVNRIAALPDGSPELFEFNERVLGRAIEGRRQYSKLINTPPRFGARSTGSDWMDHLYRLNREPGFRKSVTLKPDIDAIERLLQSKTNIWRDLLPAWRLTGVTPYGVAAHPSPALLKQQQDERLARADAEVRRLAVKYQVKDEQLAIAAYRKDYDLQTAQMEEVARKSSGTKFLADPPLTLDDTIEYRESRLRRSIPIVESVFDNMTSCTAALELRLDGIPESRLPLLSVLPALLTQSGVIENGKPVSYPAMEEMLRKQILSLDADFDVNVRNNRVELRITGAGNDLKESRRAIEWMNLALFHPDWRPENLPRLRDLVRQELARLRTTQQQGEEGWVQNPILAYYRQTSPLYLTTRSFLTQSYNADRLRWMLEDAGSPDDRAAVTGFLIKLAEAPGSSPNRATLTALAKDVPNAPEARALSASAIQVIKDVSEDLTQLVPDLPERTVAADWSFLCRQMARDIASGPKSVLDDLDALRGSLLGAANARMWLAGSRANEQELRPSLEALADGLQETQAARLTYAPDRRVDIRLRQHDPGASSPRFVGLLDQNLAGGTVLSVLPFAGYDFQTRADLIDLLSAHLFGGHGPHTLYAKTTGVGLAYSNGIRGSTHDGWLGYYAERCPEIAQTVSFAIDVVKKGSREPALAEYAIAQVFSESNASKTYEDRAEAIASDLTDGLTPARVKRFRQAILDLRRSPDLSGDLFQRIDAVYGMLLPGYGIKARNAPQALYYIIGSDKQFAAMDAAVQTREDEHVYKLYPRDYWLVPVEQ